MLLEELQINDAVALQFHPEIELELFNLWYSSDVSKQELKGYPVDSEVLYLNDNLSKLRINRCHRCHSCTIISTSLYLFQTI